MRYLRIITFICSAFYTASCATSMDSNLNAPKSDNFSVVESRFTNVQVWLPDNYDESKSYELAVIFHGRGGNSLQAYRSFFLNHPENLICIGLDAPYDDHTSDGFRRNFSYFPYLIANDDNLIKNAADSISDTIVRAIDKTKLKFKIEGKVSFIGFSQGATFALYTAMRYPASTNSLILGSGIYSEIIPENFDMLLKHNVKLSIFHGIKDTVVPLSESMTLTKKASTLDITTDFSRAIGHVVDYNFQSFIARALKTDE